MSETFGDYDSIEREPTPLEKLYAPAHNLIDQQLEAIRAGDAKLASDLAAQAAEAFREAHDHNPLLHTYEPIEDINKNLGE